MLKRLLPMPVSAEVKAEQIRLLYHQGTTILVLGIFTGIISVTMFWNVADHALLLLWLATHMTVSLIRLYAVLRFENRSPKDQAAIENWGRAYLLGTFTSGLVWAGLSLFFDPSWPAPYQVMLLVIYTGIIAGAFNTNSSLFVAFPAFYLPPAGLLTYIILNQTGEGFLELASLFMIYIVLMYVSALKFHDRLAQSLEIRFENERLAGELSQSNEKLLRLADMDELTGIYNRRSMDRCLTGEWNRHFRIQKPLSLLFIDLDFFKQYNDTYGHDGGDQCLIQIARILRHHAQRSSDMAARFGGEEFAVILPETDAAEALKIAQAIHADLEALRIPHASSAASPHVTMSIGVATAMPVRPDNDEHLRVAADKALYQAKGMGRNRVVQAPPSPSLNETLKLQATA